MKRRTTASLPAFITASTPAAGNTLFANSGRDYSPENIAQALAIVDNDTDLASEKAATTTNGSRIYDIRTNDVWLYTSQWAKDTSGFTDIKDGRLYYNPRTSKVFFASTSTSVQSLTSGVTDRFTSPPPPDVWAPLTDSLVLWEGYAPYDQINIGGSVLDLPTRSVIFSRASAATYIDKSGVLQYALPDEPRFEKYGLLIEGQGTNYMLNSDDPSKWTKGANLNRIQQADGNTGAMTGVHTASADIVQEVNLHTTTGNPITLAIGDTVTTSCRTKGTYGRLRVRIVRISDGAYVSDSWINLLTGETQAGQNMAILSAYQDGDGYWNFATSLTATEANGFVVQFRFYVAVNDTSIPSGSVVYLQMPQVEPGPRKTSYIPTGAATTTRIADNCTLPLSGNSNWWGPSTLAVEVHCNGMTTGGDTSNRRGIISYYPSAGEYALIMLDGSTQQPGKPAFAYGGTTFNYYNKRIDDGASHVIVSVSDTLQNRTFVDGDSNTQPTTATRPTPGSVSDANTWIYLGRGAGATAPGSRMLNGHIRNVRIWHQALPETKIKGLR